MVKVSRGMVGVVQLLAWCEEQATTPPPSAVCEPGLGRLRSRQMAKVVVGLSARVVGINNREINGNHEVNSVCTEMTLAVLVIVPR